MPPLADSTMSSACISCSATRRLSANSASDIPTKCSAVAFSMNSAAELRLMRHRSRADYSTTYTFRAREFGGRKSKWSLCDDGALTTT